ncbi:hypothetical protein CLU79DRAFT_754020 [Phycomyces nitens]|nr:hypothetical protein CLU79DRAFT_754020 [Phycomyces nitens]
MYLSILSQETLTFDPIKPIILRGSSTEDSSSIFSGNVVLTLARSVKIAHISVTLKSISSTYWPEGIGARGTRLTSETVLFEQKLQLVPSKNETRKAVLLNEGTHRFSFAFVIPNSFIESIDDVYGRVRHMVEAQVSRTGIPILNSWKTQSPLLVLRCYMSNSLLVNNSIQDLSRTFEKHLVTGDIEVMIEAAAFSSGDLLYIRVIIQPQRKHTRLEHMEVKVTESRRYCVPEMRAWRTNQDQMEMPFAGATRIFSSGEYEEQHMDSSDEIRQAFDKDGKGIDLTDTFAHRIAFSTPSCQQNLHPTTHFKEILFRHHLEINIVVSYPDEGGAVALSRTNSSNSLHSLHSFHSNPEQASTEHAAAQQNTQGANGGWQNVFLRLRKSRNEKDDVVDGRRKETIILETPITVFDCRLKEDYSRLPSYFELGVKPPEINTLQKSKNGPSPGQSTPLKVDRTKIFYCPCYFDFCRQLELASQCLHLPYDQSLPILDRIPSKPPPDYVDI